MKFFFSSVLLLVLSIPLKSQDVIIEQCEGEDICLAEYLPAEIDSSGSWTGPNSYSESGNCAPLSVVEESQGYYNYNYTNDDGEETTFELLLIVYPNNTVFVDSISICGNNPFFLMTYLPGNIPVGGFWTGPYWGVSGGGIFNPETDPPGEYTYYAFSLEGCTEAYTFYLGYEEMGLIQSVTYCAQTPVCLNDMVTNVELPTNGSWFYPDETPLEDCVVDPLSDPQGTYTYNYYNGDDCISEAQLEIVFEYVNSGELTHFDLCPLDESFIPYDAMEGDPDTGGTWSLFSEDNQFVALLEDWNTEISTTYIQENLSNPGAFYLVYDVNSNICPASSDTLYVDEYGTFNAGLDIQMSVCVDDSLLELSSLPGGNPDMGGNFIDAAGTVLPNQLDLANYTPGNLLQIYYVVGLPNTACLDSSLLEITLLPSEINLGNDTTLAVCESSSAFDLNNLVEYEGPELDGMWTAPDGIILETSLFTPGASLTGIYTYSASNLCSYGSLLVEIDVLPSFEAQFAESEIFICENDTLCLQIEIEGGSPPYFISYFNVNLQFPTQVGDYSPGDCILLSNPSTTTYVLDGVWDNTGCVNTFTDTLNVTIDPDSDGDGICDSDEIIGCQNSNALNYNPLATDPGPCEIGGGLSDDIWELSEVKAPLDDESYHWSGIATGGKENKDWNFKIVPNPATAGNFEVFFRGEVNSPVISIYTLEGKKVYSHSIPVNNMWSSQSAGLLLTPGIYLIEINSESRQQIEKLVVAR